MTDIDFITTIASRVSGVLALVVFVWGGMTKRIVWGWQYDQLAADFRAQITKLESDRDKARAECKEYTDLARDAAFNTRAGLVTLEKAVDQLRTAREGGR